MVRFVFCLALPEVIHLPRGLEAVTRNWRNHDSTELSAPQSPGEESDGAHCSTKRLKHLPIWVFDADFFSLYIFLSLSLNLFHCAGICNLIIIIIIIIINFIPILSKVVTRCFRKYKTINYTRKDKRTSSTENTIKISRCGQT